MFIIDPKIRNIGEPTTTATPATEAVVANPVVRNRRWSSTIAATDAITAGNRSRIGTSPGMRSLTTPASTTPGG